jgi:hypothetical protein
MSTRSHAAAAIADTAIEASLLTSSHTYIVYPYIVHALNIIWHTHYSACTN